MTAKVGLWGARADQGGLAALTYEFHRHLRPTRTMIIDLGEGGRGPLAAHLYTHGDVEVNHGYNDDITVDTVRKFCTGLDVVYFAETTYREDFCHLARAAGVRTVGHIMPELFRAGDAQPDRLWVPTGWQIDRMPAGTEIVPVPVPTDTFAPVPAEPGAALLHPTAPAFHDRNGTRLVIDALAYLDDPPPIVFTGPQRPPDKVLDRSGRRVKVSHQTGVEDRRAAYPAGCGALLLPRRYAGLSLPMQEAAGLAWPIITLDLPPQRLWVHPDLLVPAERGIDARMVAGWFNIAESHPKTVARTVRRLYDDPGLWVEAARGSAEYAERNSWANLTDTYRAALDGVAA